MTTKRNAKSSQDTRRDRAAQVRGDSLYSNTHSPLLRLQLTNGKGRSIYQLRQGTLLPWTTRHVHTTPRMSPPLMLAPALTKEIQKTSTVRSLRAPSFSGLLTSLLQLPYNFPTLIQADASIQIQEHSRSRNAFPKAKASSPKLSEQQGHYHGSTPNSASQTSNTRSLSLDGQN